MTTYQQEFMATADREEAEALMRADWEEINSPAKGDKFEIDWETYLQLESMGILKVFTARDDGRLVGYFSVILSAVLHNKGSVQAVGDAFYVHKDFRKGFVGIKLFKFVESCLLEDGHRGLVVASTEAYPLDRLLTRMGYVKAETQYYKDLT